MYLPSARWRTRGARSSWSACQYWPAWRGSVWREPPRGGVSGPFSRRLGVR